MITTKLMSCESFNYTKSYYDPILNDSAALANMAVLGAHLYGTSVSGYRYPLFDQKGAGKERWMTEHYTDSTTDANSWPNALGVATELHHAMVDGQFNLYTWWYIVRSYGPISTNGTVSKRGWCMAQFSKFIRPGFYRVDATATPMLRRLPVGVQEQHGRGGRRRQHEQLDVVPQRHHQRLEHLVVRSVHHLQQQESEQRRQGHRLERLTDAVAGCPERHDPSRHRQPPPPARAVPRAPAVPRARAVPRGRRREGHRRRGRCDGAAGAKGTGGATGSGGTSASGGTSGAAGTKGTGGATGSGGAVSSGGHDGLRRRDGHWRFDRNRRHERHRWKGNRRHGETGGAPGSGGGAGEVSADAGCACQLGSERSHPLAYGSVLVCLAVLSARRRRRAS